MFQLGETCVENEGTPGCLFEENAVSLSIVALNIGSSRIRTEEYSAGSEAVIEFSQYAIELLRWDMEKRCIGNNSIESVVRESQIEEILMPDLAV